MGKDHELDDKREMDPSPKTSDDLAIIENEKEREREKEVGLIEPHVVEGVNDPRPTNDGQVSLYLLLLIASACVGGLMFGYDTGYISGMLVQVGSDLGKPLSDGDKELITSATTLGALIGGLGAGVSADAFGRKAVIGFADLLFIVGALMQAAGSHIWVIIPGRLVMGFGVGFAACVVPLYIQEIAPSRHRGRLATLNVIAITLGQVIAYGIGAGFEHVHNGWRWMVGISTIPPFVQMVFLFYFPESPRYLIRNNRTSQAATDMRKMFPSSSEQEIQANIKALEDAIALDEEATRAPFMQRCKEMVTVGANRRALVIACALQGAQQLCGFNTLMYYSATIFSYVGFSNSTAVGLVISGTNFLFTLVALKYVDIIGRRKIIIWTIPGMIFGLVFASVCFSFMTRDTNERLVEGMVYSKTWSGLMLFAMIIFVASYATGLGNVPWLQGELFDYAHRGIGTSLATATNWSCNLVIGSTFLSLMNAITPSGAFGFYAGWCLLAWIFFLFCYCETAGVSLEEVQEIFREGWGVRGRKRRMTSLAEAREKEKQTGSLERVEYAV